MDGATSRRLPRQAWCYLEVKLCDPCLSALSVPPWPKSAIYSSFPFLYIPLRSVINVKDEDNHCFEWAILSALYPADENAHRPAKYQTHLIELNFTGIKFPAKVTDTSKFERQNPGLSVNIFGWKSILYPLHASKQAGREIDLLLLTDPKESEKTHYIWIKTWPACFTKRVSMNTASIHAAAVYTSSQARPY